MKPLIKRLKNGINLTIIPNENFATVTALVLVGAGSSYETARENGLSHFLEHMCFKGGAKYKTSREVSEALESLGSISNAFTTHEYTGYHVKGNPKHMDVFLSVLSDVYLHATFPEVEIEKEKGVIVEEINMYEDMPHFKAWQELMALMYPEQPVGRSILGTKETVTSFTRKDFLEYKKKHYYGDNTVIAICGPVKAAVAKDVEKAFGAIKAGKSKKRRVSSKQTALRFKVVQKKIDQANISIGFQSVPYRHKDSVAVKLLATILGRGMSSRLFLRVREDLGAAYSVHAEQDSFQDHGAFQIAAGIDKNRVNEIIECFAEELTRIKEELVSDTELKKAKEFSIGTLQLGLETTDDVAGYYATQLVLRKPIKTPKEVIREYTEVTAQDVKRVAKKIFVGKNASIVVVGNYEERDINIGSFAAL